jgi:hypothetical protein
MNQIHINLKLLWVQNSCSVKSKNVKNHNREMRHRRFYTTNLQYRHFTFFESEKTGFCNVYKVVRNIPIVYIYILG